MLVCEEGAVKLGLGYLEMHVYVKQEVPQIIS